MKTLFAFIVLIGIHVTAKAEEPAQKCTLSVEKINSEIQKDGAQKAFSAIAHDGRWKSFLICIATGQSEWVAIDETLDPYAHGSAGEELTEAIGEALANQPENVFRVTKHRTKTGYALDAICSGPNLDDVRFNSYALAMNEISRRERALLSVTDKDLIDDVNSCRGYLEDAKKWVAHMFDKE